MLSKIWFKCPNVDKKIIVHECLFIYLFMIRIVVSWLRRREPLEKLWGGGGAGGRSTKKKFAQGKIKLKKILARQLTLKNVHAMA